MILTELTLAGREMELRFRSEVIAVLEQRNLFGKNDGLRIRFKLAGSLDLPAAIDVSERLPCPRLFIIEGGPDDRFLTFGGEKLYWISHDGSILNELSLYRHYQDAEYWETKFITRSQDLVIIYEAGVLILDPDLHVVFHKKKFLNDFLEQAFFLRTGAIP